MSKSPVCLLLPRLLLTLCDCRVSAITESGNYATAKDFYDYMLHKISIKFFPRGGNKDDEDTFEIELSRKMSYEQFSVKVGEHLGVDPTHIRFSTINAATNKPKLPVKRSLNQTLWQTLSPQFNTYNANQRNDALFYEVMDISLSELETKKPMRLIWVTEGLTKEVN